MYFVHLPKNVLTIKLSFLLFWFYSRKSLMRKISTNSISWCKYVSRALSVYVCIVYTNVGLYILRAHTELFIVIKKSRNCLINVSSNTTRIEIEISNNKSIQLYACISEMNVESKTKSGKKNRTQQNWSDKISISL